MNADHAAFLVGEDALQVSLERACRVAAVATELAEHRVAAPVVARDRAAPGRVPDDVLVEDLGERLDVGGVECRVAAPDERCIRVLRDDVGHSPPPLDWQCWSSLALSDQASYRPPSSATCGLPLCPASCMIGGTSGSEAKLCQPAASQSKITQTRSASFGIAEDRRALRAVLLALLGALRREDLLEAVEVLDRRRCQDHRRPPLVARRRQSTPMVSRVCAERPRHGIGRTPYPRLRATRSCSKAQSVAAARLRTPAFW